MAIQQHPLPQDISSYRFRLIGDMTIKQFASLAISIIVAIFVYGSPLPFFFKYPLAFMFVVLGIGMAFVPLQGRTLDVWIIAFLKSIYAPTLFSWKRTPVEDLNPDTIAPAEDSLQTSAPAVSNAEIEINKGISTTTTPASTSQPSQAVEVVTPVQTEPSSTITPPSNTASVTQATTSETTEVTSITATIAPPTTTTTVIPESSSTAPTEAVQPSTTQTTVSTETTPTTPTAVAVSSPISEPKITTPAAETPAIPKTTQETQPVQAATANLPIPFTPTTPNTLVGLTISKDNHIIDGVLVEIKKNGLTTRATKSNKLGQFMFARPLENGVFQILAEKDGFTFTTYSLELTGEIIRPLKIQAQS